MAAALPDERLGDWQLIECALDELGEEQREVLVLRFLCDLTLAEVAQVQNCSINTVNSRQRYGLQALRKQLMAREELNRGRD